MAAALPVVALVASAVSTGMQYKAGQDAKKAGRENARLAQMEAAEEARRLQREQKKQQAAATARAAASGGTISGSSELFMKTQQQEHAKQLQWLKTAGKMQASVYRKQGSAAATQATGGAIGTLGSAASYGYNIYGS